MKKQTLEMIALIILAFVAVVINYLILNLFILL
jgi:hypothetical protein